MQVIKPTPSQAAVVLQNFLKQQGVPLKLGTAQEAIARTQGYSSWNALASDVPVRGEKRLRQEPKSTKAPPTSQSAVAPLLLDDIRQESERVRDADIDARNLLCDLLKDKFDKAIEDSGLLGAYTRQTGRDECWVEEAGPYVQVSYDLRHTVRFSTELVFTIRDGEPACYVRTWEFLDRLSPSSDYTIFDERSGDFDTDLVVPQGPNATVEDLVRSALEEAARHTNKLRDQVNV